MVKNLESNHDMWVRIIEDETEQNNDTDTTDANVPSSSVTVYFIYIIFLRDAMHSADYAVARWSPSICLSVCPSLTGILSKRLNTFSTIQ